MLENQELKITEMLSTMLVNVYTADVKHGGQPSLEDITKFYQRDFNKFTKDKAGADLAIFNWSDVAGPAYDLAICTLIETGTLQN
jgi:hypothetical protein